MTVLLVTLNVVPRPLPANPPPPNVPMPQPPPGSPPASEYPIAISASGAGAVVLPSGERCNSGCTPSFAAGSSVTLHADATEGSYFAQWSGDCAGSAAECTLVLDGPKTVAASFAPYQFVLTLTTAGNGYISVSYGGDCRGTCAFTYGFGAYVTLTAVPDAGSTFAGWDNECTSSQASCTIGMFGDSALTASFSP